MNIKEAKLDHIYKYKSELRQWDGVVFVYRGEEGERVYLDVIIKEHEIIEYGIRNVNINSKLAKEGKIIHIGTEEDHPEYFL